MQNLSDQLKVELMLLLNSKAMAKITAKQVYGQPKTNTSAQIAI